MPDGMSKSMSTTRENAPPDGPCEKGPRAEAQGPCIENLSLGKRVRRCPSFRCLGLHANFEDFSPEDKEALRQAPEIYYPTSLYEDLFVSVGKRVFPRSYYRFVGNKIRQSDLFRLLGIPHPRTRLYYGRNRIERIREDFPYPFVAKTPLGSSQGEGVWRVENDSQLAAYLEAHRPAYIQEYLPVDRDLRVVLVARQVVHAYWRIARPGEFRNNVSRGASISFENVPEEGLRFARDVARKCRFDEVGLDVCLWEGRYYVLEANMAFGLKGFRQAGLDLHEIFAGLDARGHYEIPEP